ncbi:flagellar export chaperone FliS [Microbacterium sp. ANT_H45B]|uniref:flagellar export chaperone FliS n=1 Tax=Microbacterium sp. ANT_H45B TaxID=2597346 RepID=UPI0011EE2493|nr:flagellar export chaperone FliS [Microbacterium sp. ANT_H45B]KAA0960829.1 flagellar export chaperone FliS [Microbacterium sp. ANT_H45B]
MALTSLDRAKQQYLEQQVASATPERLLTLLYDRLLVDIDRAASAQDAGDWNVANTHLTHAQSIVAELHGSLTDAWDAAAELRGVYTYLTGRLISANVSRDRAATLECRQLVAPLREAWHEAAELTAVAAPRASALG